MKRLSFGVSWLSVTSCAVFGCGASVAEETVSSVGAPALPSSEGANSGGQHAEKGGKGSALSSASPRSGATSSATSVPSGATSGVGSGAVGGPVTTGSAMPALGGSVGKGGVVVSTSATPTMASPAPTLAWDKQSVPYAQSGKRLEARAYAVADIRRFRAFRDSELGFDCTFVPDTSKEVFHCAPTQSEPLMFLDSKCAYPATWDAKAAPLSEGTYLGMRAEGTPYDDWDNDAPSSPRMTYRVGAVLFSGTGKGSPDWQTFYSLSASGECIAGAMPPTTYKLPPPISETHQVRRLELVNDAELVAAKPTQISIEGGLKLVRLEAEDGSEVNVGTQDETGTYCRFLGRDNLCVPMPVLVAQTLNEDFWGVFDSIPKQTIYGTVGTFSNGAEYKVYGLRPVGLVPDYTGPGLGVRFVAEQEVTQGLGSVSRNVEGSESFRQEWYTARELGGSRKLQIQPVAHYYPFEFIRTDASPCYVNSLPDGQLRCGDAVVTEVRLD